MELLQGIEQLGLVRLLKASFAAYPIVNALHIAAIGGLFTSVILLDLSVLGALRPPGGKAFIVLMRRIAFVAFAGAVVTGLLLFSVRASEYAFMPVFQLKLGLIALAGFNLLLFVQLERRGGSGLRLLAAASLVLWSGALLCGRFIGFV
ncbi:hypothetical protein [Arvimicrobium flavum]|uniref:hypothetical protein n=1 Tax=Arvimicrobium flavum TaxID=3393320 RepID=UPI00237A09E2|nr:hypothetical protein [Mesorhizobium shangrilense]